MPKRLWFTSFTQILCEAVQEGQVPTLPPDSRARAVAEMECILLSPPELHAHHMTLFKLLHNEFPYLFMPSKQELSVIAADGLWVMTNEELAMFILNPMAQLAVAHSVECLQPKYWLDRLESVSHEKRLDGKLPFGSRRPCLRI